MEAKELRIGNFVTIKEHLKGEIAQNCFIDTGILPGLDSLKVSMICIDQIHLEVEKEEIEFDYTEILSLQLTREWLLKFGFKERKIHWYDKSVSECIYEKDNYCVEFSPYNDGMLIVFFKINLNEITQQGNYICNIDYVHQLQNLYFAITGKELICS